MLPRHIKAGQSTVLSLQAEAQGQAYITVCLPPPR